MAACYGTNSFDESISIPCGVTNNSDPSAACCVRGDYCMSNAICKYTHSLTGGSGYYVADCTDANFNSPNCRTAYIENPKSDPVYDSVANIWRCCSFPNNGTTRNCSEPTDEDFEAPAPSELITIQALPAMGSPTYATSATDTTTATAAISSATSATPATSGSFLGSSSSSTSKPASQDSTSQSLSTGTKAGIGVGVAVGILLLVLISLLIYDTSRRRNRDRTSLQPATASGEMSDQRDQRGLEYVPSSEATSDTQDASTQPIHELLATPSRGIHEIGGYDRTRQPHVLAAELNGNSTRR